VRVLGPDHVVLVSPDPERLLAWYRDTLGIPSEREDAWRAGQVLFVSLRLNDTFLIDIFGGDRTGTNVDHVALVVDGVDLDELAASGRFDIDMGPMDLWGAQGTGRGLYVRDPDGNRVELRTY
jgi:catechol 2,3-dioxygenase-like lactoylglutathione lyase family enzyme